MNFIKQRNKMIKDMKEAGINDPEIEVRLTGRSTAYALRTIGLAMLNPNKPIAIIDHYSDNPTHLKRTMIPLIGELLGKLNLIGFKVSLSKLTLTYSLDNEV